MAQNLPQHANERAKMHSSNDIAAGVFDALQHNCIPAGGKGSNTYHENNFMTQSYLILFLLLYIVKRRKVELIRVGMKSKSLEEESKIKLE